MNLETMFITSDGPVATVHLRRVERLNAFGNQGTRDLNAAADALAQDESLRVVGLGRAKQLILSGQLLGARAAQAIGLVDEVVTDAELARYVSVVAQGYLQLPWTSVLLSKRLTNQAFDQPLDAFLPEYFAAQREAMRSANHAAALQAYRDEQARKMNDE